MASNNTYDIGLLRRIATRVDTALQSGDDEALDKVLETIDRTYGQEKGPQVLRYARQLNAAPPESQGPIFNELDKLFPREPTKREMPGAGALAAGIGVMGDELLKNFASPEEAAAISQRQVGVAANYPIAAKVGEFLGGAGPAIAGEAALIGIPAAKAVSMIPGVRQLPGALGRAIWNPVTQAGAVGAGLGAANPEKDPTQEAILGSSGALVGKLIGDRLVRAKSVQPEHLQDLVAKKRAEGYWAGPGLRTGNVADMQKDNAMRSNQGTGPIVKQKLDENQQRFNMEVGDAMGLNNQQSLDIDTLLTQSKTLGKDLEDFYAQYAPKFTGQDALAQRNAVVRYASRSGRDAPPELQRFNDRIDRLRKVAAKSGNQKHAAQLFKTLKSDVSNNMTYHLTHPSGDVRLGEAYKRLDAMLDRAITRGAPKEAVEQWAEKRGQYAFLKEALGDKEMLVTGNAKPAAVQRMFSDMSGKANIGYIERRRDLLDSARFMQNQQKSFMPSFAMTQRLSSALDPKHTASVFNLLPNVSQLPLMGEGYARSYLGGYPGVTGLLNLPAGGSTATQALGGATAIGANSGAPNQYQFQNPGLLEP